MTEDEARQWLARHVDVSRETFDRLGAYVDLLLTESAQQNLIARSTFETVWERHIVDSAQLLPLGGFNARSRSWLDIGSGAGLPGIVLAILGCHVTLVEPRAKRVTFLQRAVEALGLTTTTRIEGAKIENLRLSRHDIITARAFAPMEKTFRTAGRLLARDGLWILPRGKSVEEELAAVRDSWQGAFRTVQSATSDDASIVVAQQVRRRT